MVKKFGRESQDQLIMAPMPAFDLPAFFQTSHRSLLVLSSSLEQNYQNLFETINFWGIGLISQSEQDLGSW
jgi:hypothetical protein